MWIGFIVELRLSEGCLKCGYVIFFILLVHVIVGGVQGRPTGILCLGFLELGRVST